MVPPNFQPHTIADTPSFTFPLLSLLPFFFTHHHAPNSSSGLCQCCARAASANVALPAMASLLVVLVATLAVCSTRAQPPGVCFSDHQCSGGYCVSNKCASSKLADGEHCDGSSGPNDACAGGYCIFMTCGSSLGPDGAACMFGSECASGHCPGPIMKGHCSSAMVAMSMAEKKLVAMRNGSAFPAQQNVSFAMIVAVGAIAGAAFAGVALHLVGRRRSSEHSDTSFLLLA